MRFYQGQHRFYCGIDLHARSMHVCVVDHAGDIVFDGRLATRPEALLRALEPFRDGLVIGVECMFAWYWVADFCVTHAIAFVLGQDQMYFFSAGQEDDIWRDIVLSLRDAHTEN